MSSIPIVTLHRHNPAYPQVPIYLIYCLAQAKKFNPQSDIFLLGDYSNKYLQLVKHRYFTDYMEGAEEFEKVYADKHMNNSDFLYEIFCFQRWFIIRDFMRKNQIAKCVHIDTDVMLFANITEEQKKFDASDLTLSNKGSGHICFLKLKGIEDYCDFLIDFYTKPSLISILESLWEEKKSRPGGICDMTLFNQYYQRNSHKIILTSDIINDSVYDPSINVSDGYEMHNGIKNFYWVDGIPFCRHLESDKGIKFNSIHFQGFAKDHMKAFCTANKFLVFYYRFKRKARNILFSIKKNLTISKQ